MSWYGNGATVTIGMNRLASMCITIRAGQQLALVGDDWNESARFDVLFDGSKETVHSTLSLTESQMGLCGGDGSCICGHAK